MTIVDRIKLLCQKRDMSLNELERELNFGKNSIYRWKERNPSIDKIDKVADYFNVTTDYLLGREQFDNSDLFAAHIEDDLTEEERIEIEKYLKFIRSQKKE
ncbi:helix-turn-helix domain-containing protein [Listeria seeligeri]|uniref:helix-turn-helix domain-containing protein n=1 Tax=Listeria seeligeri TaxID=1640 RepID=UPI0022EB3C37|nr:helix-turn-helix transcriptional regulator [Listeria seeligeri]